MVNYYEDGDLELLQVVANQMPDIDETVAARVLNAAWRNRKEWWKLTELDRHVGRKSLALIEATLEKYPVIINRGKEPEGPPESLRCLDTAVLTIHEFQSGESWEMFDFKLAKAVDDPYSWLVRRTRKAMGFDGSSRDEVHWTKLDPRPLNRVRKVSNSLYRYPTVTDSPFRAKAHVVDYINEEIQRLTELRNGIVDLEMRWNSRTRKEH